MSSQLLLWQHRTFPSWLDHICWFVLCLSAFSISHRAIYMAGFLLFRGSKAAVWEKAGLDTGSLSQLTAPLFHLDHPTGWLTPHQHSAVSFTICGTWQEVRSSKIAPRCFCWSLIWIHVIMLFKQREGIFPSYCSVVVVHLTHDKSSADKSYIIYTQNL